MEIPPDLKHSAALNCGATVSALGGTRFPISLWCCSISFFLPNSPVHFSQSQWLFNFGENPSSSTAAPCIVPHLSKQVKRHPPHRA
jgi:hypothetical protein